MSRKKFMEAHGASNSNDRHGWGFVNHKNKVVIFGAWDINTQIDRSLILAMDWERNDLGRKQNAFGESLEYVKLVENEGYQLQTFPIIVDTNFDDGQGAGKAKIKTYVEELSDMKLEIINGDYYAVGRHKTEYATKPLSGLADDIADIFDSEVDKTERRSLVMSRAGQGRFRKNVIDVWGNGECCALTLTSVKELLIASHIVPWSVWETNEQRLDGANGILLCAHIDKLFDCHKLTFEKQGRNYLTRLSPTLDKNTLRGLGVEAGLTLCIDQMKPKFQNRFDDYLKHHNGIFNQKL